MKAFRGDSMSELELLDRVLASTLLASDVYFAGEPCGDWRLNTSGSGHAAFHLVLRGSPWIHLPSDAGSRRQLHSGDFAFFARDVSHVLTNAEDAPAATDTLIPSVRPVGATDGETALICGKLRLEQYAQRFLLAPLPDVVVMPGSGESTPKIVSGVVSIMWEEVRGQDKPLSVTLNKLADVLVAQVLRFTVSTRLVSSGVFAGLADRHLGRAVLELIRAPEQAWSVERLAQKAHMSRSAFASRFQSVVGRTPLDFLRDWRMQLAVGLLRSGRSVADVAHAAGYDSEASFAKAFKRVIGVGPGTMRSR
jgi:AraC family transcriptional activator of mtrCDE